MFETVSFANNYYIYVAILSRNLMYMDPETIQLSWHYSCSVEKIGGKYI